MSCVEPRVGGRGGGSSVEEKISYHSDMLIVTRPSTLVTNSSETRHKIHRLYGTRKSTATKAKIPIRINTTETATTGVW